MPGYARNTAPPFLELIPTPMNSRSCLEAASPQFGCGLVKHGQLQSTNVRGCHGKQAPEAASSAHEQKPSLLYMACLRYVRLRGSHKRSHLLLGFVWWGLACLTARPDSMKPGAMPASCQAVQLVLKMNSKRMSFSLFFGKQICASPRKRTVHAFEKLRDMPPQNKCKRTTPFRGMHQFQGSQSFLRALPLPPWYW